MASTTKSSQITKEISKEIQRRTPKKRSKKSVQTSEVSQDTLKEQKRPVKTNYKRKKNKKTRKTKRIPKETEMSQDFDFVSHFDENTEIKSEDLLPDNEAESAISCAFVGVGAGGGKLAKAFLDLGYNKTLLVNTTEKDQPDDIPEEHVVLVPGADGVGKDVVLGSAILEENSAVVEDALKTKIGSVDWLFVCAGGGGGTGSSVASLHGAFERYLKSVQAGGKVVYIITQPTAQERLNPTIKANSSYLRESIEAHPHVVLDNEKQLQLLRGKVGMLNMYPAANAAFAKMLSHIFKLAAGSSSVQVFDAKDLEACLNLPGRIFVGTSVIRDTSNPRLGSMLYQNCLKGSPCESVNNKPNSGALLLIGSTDVFDDPDVSNRVESAISYVGGRVSTLFSGVYVNDDAPGLVSIMMLCGI